MQIHITKHGTNYHKEDAHLLDEILLDCPECGCDMKTSNITYIITDKWYGGYVDGFTAIRCPKCNCEFTVKNRISTVISTWLKIITVIIILLVFVAVPIALFIIGTHLDNSTLKIIAYSIFTVFLIYLIFNNRRR